MRIFYSVNFWTVTIYLNFKVALWPQKTFEIKKLSNSDMKEKAKKIFFQFCEYMQIELSKAEITWNKKTNV